jgi:uncharacterized protein (TIGR02118 family)
VIKVVFAFRKRSTMEWEEFRRYAADEHAPLVEQLPELRRYVQSLVLPDQTPEPRPFDGVAELWFDSEEAYRRAFDSPVGRAVVADASNYADPDSDREIRMEDVAVFP